MATKYSGCRIRAVLFIDCATRNWISVVNFGAARPPQSPKTNHENSSRAWSCRMRYSPSASGDTSRQFDKYANRPSFTFLSYFQKSKFYSRCDRLFHNNELGLKFSFYDRIKAFSFLNGSMWSKQMISVWSIRYFELVRRCQTPKIGVSRKNTHK